MTALVVGFAVTGQAVAAALGADGEVVIAVDDATGPGAVALGAAADRLGVELHLAPSPAEVAALAARADLVVLSPGVPPTHPIFAAPTDGELISEIELGWRLLAARPGRAPLAAVTGTNGKTTVTSLVVAMLEASGIPAVAAGNIGLPLVELAARPPGVRVDPTIVVEVSSFQLAKTRTFRPDVSCFLNLAEDHLDWHPDLADYADAKARIWANQGPDDVAVVNAEDPTVLAAAETCPARLVSFGLSAGDYRVEGGSLVAPGGEAVVAVADLPRALPHDLANAAAACAIARAARATTEGCKAALVAGVAMPHRIELVGEADGVSWFDDSKATTPAAVVAALAGFDSVVLIAGGRNKGLDLGAIPRALGSGSARLRAVVAIGEAAGEVEAAFAHVAPVHHAASMAEAVDIASWLAEAGDAVVLSPGCASFDWYRSYVERGDDFARTVSAHLREGGGNRRVS